MASTTSKNEPKNKQKARNEHNLKGLLTIALIICCSLGLAQEPPKHISLSKKQIAKVNRTNDPLKKLKKYARFYSKDSVRHMRKVRKYWKQRLKAASNELQASSTSETELVKEVEGKVNEELRIGKDELGIRNEEIALGERILVDSALLESAKEKGKEEWEALEKPEELKGLEGYNDMKLDPALKQRVFSEVTNGAKAEFSELENPKELEERITVRGIKLDSTLTDSAAVAKVQKQLLDRGEEELRKTSVIRELEENKSSSLSTTKNFFQTTEELTMTEGQLDSAALKQQALERAKAQVMQVAQQTRALNKVNRLKSKYGKVLNSNDLSTAVKRNSLEGVPLGERIVLGGNFNIQSREPFSADVSGSFGYQFSKRLIVGIQGSYRLGNVDSTAVLGGRAFINYDLTKNFFMATEFEMMRKKLERESTVKNEWHPGMFIGIGRSFPVLPKMNAQVALMYNLLHDNQEGIYNRPIVVRFGYNYHGLFKGR